MDTDQILAEAEKAEKNGDLKAAIRLCDTALETERNNQIVRERLGWCLSRDQQYSRAADLFQQLAQAQPDVAKWPYMAGFQYYQQQRWRDAIVWFNNSLKLNPGYVVVLYRKGYSHFKAGEIGEALQAFQRCRSLWHALADGPTKEKDKKNCAKAAYHQAEILVENPHKIEGGVEGAVPLLREAIDLDPDNHNNHYLLGKALLELNRPADAIVELERSDQIHRGADYVLDRLALGLAQLDRLEEAERIYERIPVKSRKDYILRNLGRIQMRKKQYSKAINTLNQSIQKNRRNHFGHYYLGLCYRETGQYGAAIKEIRDAISLRKRHFNASFDEAQQVLDDILTSHPEANETRADVPIHSGTVVKYFEQKGYGFIQDHAGDTIFFHVTDCYDKSGPPIGTPVQFELAFGEKGKKAIRIQALEGNRGTGNRWAP